jgi:ATP-dependent RNA helicase RhlE
MHLNVGSEGLSVNKDITQEILRVDRQMESPIVRLMETCSELLKDRSTSMIVFCNTKNGCDRVAERIQQETGVRCNSIHGDKSQEQRNRALDEFRSNRAPVIVATDVAARGIDIKGVSHVINFEFPSGGVEDWVPPP